MSGISGIWNVDGRPLESAHLSLLSAQLKHRGLDGYSFWISGSVGLSCQLTRNAPESASEVQPCVHENCVVVLDGRLDDRDELILALANKALNESTPSPKLIAAAYQKWGDEFVSRVNGDFAFAVFDTVQPKLLLARDAIGPRPLYYFKLGGSVVFASEITALLTHPSAPREPGRQGVGEYLIGAQGSSSATTLFKDICRVIPAHTTVFTREREVTRKYWDFDPSQRVRLKNFDEYAEALSFQFERAVKRRIRSNYPVGVFVSGGLDSSSILCLAETLRKRKATPSPAVFGACHSGPPGTLADEIAFVECIERDHSITIPRIERSVVRSLARGLQKLSTTEAPELDLFAQNNDDLAQVLRAKGVRTLLAGHWGDHLLSSQTYLVDMAYRMRWLGVYKHLREYPRWLTEAQPKAFVSLFKRELARDLLTAHWPKTFSHVLGRLRSKTVLKLRDSVWYSDAFRQEVKVHGATYDLTSRKFPTAAARSYYNIMRGTFMPIALEYDNKWLSHFGMESASPFLDRELIAFGLAIPAEMQVWNGVPKALFRRAMHGILPSEIQQRRSKGDVTELMDASVIECFDQLVQCLHPPTKAEEFGFVDGDVLREELKRMQTESPRDSAAAWRLLSLVGLEQWLKTFFPAQSATAGNQ
jgi:asparagine synthase (glutamine-hydrolysing)